MDVVAEVTEELIAEVLATATGIPVFKLTEEESARLLRMEDELHKRVIGQNDAIKALSQSIRRTRAGLKDPKRPGGSFIFAGPSGVGKTELSKTLAEFLFGDEDALIQLDMSEFMEKHTVSRLFGSPPGYVGYEEGGQLTEKVRRKPFSVVLFDEIEKAHPDIFNSLLQILEDGRLTDAQGRVVDFKNTVVIMTTNLGTRDISKGLSVGFARENDEQGSYDRMKSKVNEELKQHFRPEFLNRVDDTVVFHQLTPKEIIQIVDLMIAKVDDRLKDRDMGIELRQDAKDLLAERGYDPVLGARPLRRTIQREIEDNLSEKILYGELHAGEIVMVGVEGTGETAKFTFVGEPKPDSVPTPRPPRTRPSTTRDADDNGAPRYRAGSVSFREASGRAGAYRRVDVLGHVADPRARHLHASGGQGVAAVVQGVDQAVLDQGWTGRVRVGGRRPRRRPGPAFSTGPVESRRTARRRPRHWRSVPAYVWPLRGGPSWGGLPDQAPGARRRRRGQSAQRGARAVQTRAPSSITATAQRAATAGSAGQQGLRQAYLGGRLGLRRVLDAGHQAGQDAADVGVQYGVAAAVGEARDRGGGVRADARAAPAARRSRRGPRRRGAPRSPVSSRGGSGRAGGTRGGPRRVRPRQGAPRPARRASASAFSHSS